MFVGAVCTVLIHSSDRASLVLGARTSQSGSYAQYKEALHGFNVGFCAGLVLVLVRARSWNDRVRKWRRAPTCNDMSADYHPHHIYVARATTGAPILGEAAYARNRGQTSSSWLLMLIWHMPRCCSCAMFLLMLDKECSFFEAVFT